MMVAKIFKLKLFNNIFDNLQLKQEAINNFIDYKTA